MKNPVAASAPRLSVILVTPDRFDRLGATIEALRRQTAAAEIEIVVVAPSAHPAGLDEQLLGGFAGWQVVESGPYLSSARARAEGVRAAKAPLIAFTEDHCLPEPEWARTFIEAHREPWAAVGPEFRNGNPDSLTSWVNFLIEYGPWASPAEPGSRDHLPGHNSSYKRDLLLEYGERLAEMLEAESVLQWDLRARGHRLCLEPAAKSRHFNFSRALPSISLRIGVGRMFGAARARGWSLPRRAAFAAASPLIPLLRLARLTKVARRCGDGRRLPPTIVPALLAGLVADGFGEFLGYAFGGGDSVARVSALEHDRERYMQPADRATFASAR